MEKLIRILLVLGGGWILIRFLRWIFSISQGSLKNAHFGISTFGFNIVEAAAAVFIVIILLGVLLEKEE